LNGTAPITYGEYVRVSYISPGVWDMHVYKQAPALPDYSGTYAPLVHTHVIADVTGLQTALDTKVDVGHTHAIADVTGLQIQLVSKIGFANTVVYTPTADYHPASKKYVDENRLTTDGYGPLLGQQLDWVTSKVAFGATLLASPSGGGTAAAPGTMTVDVRPFSINALTDVDTITAAPTVGQMLQWDGTNWMPATLGPIKPAPLVTINYAVTTSLNFGSAREHNTHYRLGAATNIAVAVPPDSNWTGADTYLDNNFSPLNPGPMPIGGSAIFTKTGTGNITFVPGSGVTINSPDGLTVDKLMGKVTIVKVAPNVWDVSGYLAAAVVAPTYTYKLKSGTASTYFSNYQAAYSTGTFTNFSDTFDATQLPTGATLTDPTTITLTRVGFSTTPTAIGVTSLGTDTFFSAWEFTAGTFTGTGAVGYFTQGYAGPFDPNTAAGGPFGVYYTSTGVLAGYGDSTSGTATAPTWTTGDIIGMVYDSQNANIIFFKNGVNVGTKSVVNNGGYTMCGLF
jgi:hypothetical protein